MKLYTENVDTYLKIKSKFLISLAISFAWLGFSVWASLPWYADLSTHIGEPLSVFFITFIAIVPGFINSFVVSSLLFDHRPVLRQIDHYPDVTLLIPAYNEESSIQETVESALNQDYPSTIRVIVINDGSSDQTIDSVQKLQTKFPQLELINIQPNGGKAAALNAGLDACKTELVITVDADCWILKDGIKHLVARYLSDPSSTKAVAGAILIRNSRENWITKAQEWDYFLGIASVKRIQSLFQGTLVAQGAFSIYNVEAVRSLGGWPRTVGEDIVLTWSMLKAGHRVGHAENACVFTKCPNTLKQFVKQRQRWSRGLIEAFKANPGLIIKPRLSTIYIWWNLLFPVIDVAYTFGFIPGLILACFGEFWIVGPMTLALIPPGILLNYVMFRAEGEMFHEEHLKVRRNIFGFVFYVLAYSIVLQPACVWGYISEIFNFKKTWGTK